MKKLNIYLDTSVINFLFADDAPEKQTLTKEFFDEYIVKDKFNTYISNVVIEEISKTNDLNKRQQLLDVISSYGLIVFETTENADKLAMEYVKRGIIPERKFEDALHLAVSTVNEMDVLVSWNFKHLANVNKERQVISVNISQGYNYPMRLTTPMEVMD